MDWELFKAIVDEATLHGPRSFSLHLFGEPLLWPRILSGVRYIKTRNRAHNICLTTNGTHLNRFVDGLIDAGVDEILWTWRREAKFRDSTKKTLLASTRAGTTRFRVRLIREITPPEAWKEWKAWPYKDVKNMHNYGGEIDSASFGAPSAPARWPCYHLWLAPAVAWNGNILLCCSDPHQSYVLGKFPKTRITDAWRGAAIEKMRVGHLEGRYEGPCKDCDVWRTYPSLHFKHQLGHQPRRPWGWP